MDSSRADADALLSLKADTPAYDTLSKRQADLVATHACTQLQHFHKLLDRMESAKTVVPDPYA